MTVRVALDSSVLIPMLTATANVTGDLQEYVALADRLRTEATIGSIRLVIPAPAMAEVLAWPKLKSADRELLRRAMFALGEIASFDHEAAALAGMMRPTEQIGKGKAGLGRQCLKFDAAVSATAMIEQVDVLCAEDGDHAALIRRADPKSTIRVATLRDLGADNGWMIYPSAPTTDDGSGPET